MQGPASVGRIPIWNSEIATAAGAETAKLKKSNKTAPSHNGERCSSYQNHACLVALVRPYHSCLHA